MDIKILNKKIFSILVSVFSLIFLFGGSFYWLKKTDFLNFKLFKATVAPEPPFSEETVLNLKEVNLDNLLFEEKPESPELLSAEIQRKERETAEVADQRKQKAEQKIGIGSEALNLEGIQEILDDISERVDVLEREVIDLVEERRQISKESSDENNKGAKSEEKETEDKGVVEEQLERKKTEGQEQESDEKGSEEEKEVQREKEKRYSGSSGGGGSSRAVSNESSYCSPSEEAEATRDKVIINEIAWMGTTSAASNEWIELKNITNYSINLSGWQLLDKARQIKVIFTAQATIPAHSFFLLERTDDDTVPEVAADVIYTGALNDTDESLALFDNDCQLQDKVIADPDWPAGEKEERRSMERKNDLSWQTYYGEGEGEIFGTPKAENSQLLPSQPILEVFPQDLQFTAVEFGINPSSQTLTISNTGAGKLNWVGIIEYVSPSDSSWLNIEPDSGTAPSQVLVIPDVSNLTSETYHAKITITSQGTEGSPKEVEVVLDLNPRQEEELCPDINKDGKVNVLDMILVRNDLANIREHLNQPPDQITSCFEGTEDERCPDINKDGKINILDMILVRNELLTVRAHLNQPAVQIPACGN